MKHRLIFVDMRFLAFISVFLFSFQFANAQIELIRIGILAPQKPKSIQIIPEFGTYELRVDGKLKHSLKATDRMTFELRGALVQVSIPGRVVGQFKNPILASTNEDAYLRLYVLNPKKTERVYDDAIEVSAGKGQLKLVNKVALEKYVAGVVEAETGKQKLLEFYKVQAVISRTYALSNMRRFWREGYNLNDQVDCQVYHGKCRWEPDILSAVLITEGKVLVDSEMRLITAAFHSNSGGETVSSESVWSGSLPYLSPRLDEYSLEGSHANWEVTVAREAWLKYLKDRYGLLVEDRLIAAMAENYVQDNRQTFFLDPDFNIPLKEIRRDWKLKSTYFNILPSEGDSLKFDGRGFGHGTGLSQEGAMRMADLGFEYTDILHFYYNDVHVVDLHALDFFKME